MVHRRMIDTIQINEEIYTASKRLGEGAKKLFFLAKNMAEAEREYRQALAITIVELKEEKTPTTLIPDIARGKTADLKFKRDLAEAQYTAGRDSLKAISEQLSGLQSILKWQSEL